ncbi:MAG: hypothetical protein JKY15_07335 [Deltaproteobacteria bacterium]|nr:hypothetical protein [Deltaproteobacteria bacterium]
MSILDKIAKIEALIEQAGSEGERQAAKLAKERILAQMAHDREHQPVEYKVSAESPWKKRLFSTICDKHGYETYRYHGQRYTTSHIKISKAMMEGVLWPEYLRWARVLDELVDEVMKDVIGKIHKSEAEETVIMGALGGNSAQVV